LFEFTFTLIFLDLIPFLLKCLDSSYPDVEIEVLKKAEDCVSSKLIGYLQFKTHLLPKIDSLCRRTPYSSVRVNCVVCLGRVSSILDKDSLIGVVSPLLDHCLKIDDSPTLLMSIVGVYSRIAKQCDTHYITQRVLPALLPIAMSKSFNLDQFTKYMKTVKGLLEVVEMERLQVLKKEDELNQVNQSNQSENMDEILEEDFQKKPPVKKVPKEKVPVEEPKVTAPIAPSGFDDGFDVSDYEQKPTVETPQFDKLLNQFENPGMRKAPESVQPTTAFGGGFDSPTFGADENTFKPTIQTTKSTSAFDDLLNKQTGISPVYTTAPVTTNEKKFESLYDTNDDAFKNVNSNEFKTVDSFKSSNDSTKKTPTKSSDPFGGLTSDPAFSNMKAKPKPLPEIPPPVVAPVDSFSKISFDDNPKVTNFNSGFDTSFGSPTNDIGFGGSTKTTNTSGFGVGFDTFEPLPKEEKKTETLSSFNVGFHDDDDELDAWSIPTTKTTTSVGGVGDLDSLMDSFGARGKDPFDF
jgi:hypothetical protein